MDHFTRKRILTALLLGTLLAGGISGLHERISVEVMLTRWLGLSAEIGEEWMLFNSPDVGDGVECSLGGILRFQMSGGVRFYF